MEAFCCPLIKAHLRGNAKMNIYSTRVIGLIVFFRACLAISLPCQVAMQVGCGSGTPNVAAPTTELPQRPQVQQLEGTWRGEVAQDDRKYVQILRFLSDSQLISDVRLALLCDSSRESWQEYPGPVSEFRYQVRDTTGNEGELVVNMVSMQIEGKEQPLSSDRKTPQIWPYRVISTDVMEMTLSLGGQARAVVMRREE